MAHTHTQQTQTIQSRSWVREDEACNIDVGEHSRHHADDNGVQTLQGPEKAMAYLHADPNHTYTHIHTLTRDTRAHTYHEGVFYRWNARIAFYIVFHIDGCDVCSFAVYGYWLLN